MGTPTQKQQPPQTDKALLLTLDSELHEALKLRAFKDKTSMREILRKLARDHVKPELKQVKQ